MVIVSHELRTPLTAIDGWLHIILGGEPGPLTGEQRRFLTTVKRNSDRLTQLVGDLLFIGQFDAGIVSIELGIPAAEREHLFERLTGP